MRTLLYATLPLLFCSLSGCQCFRGSEVVYDTVDDVSDHLSSSPRLDNLYHEELDATRWCMHRPGTRCTCPGTFPRHRPR